MGLCQGKLSLLRAIHFHRIGEERFSKGFRSCAAPLCRLSVVLACQPVIMFKKGITLHGPAQGAAWHEVCFKEWVYGYQA